MPAVQLAGWQAGCSGCSGCSGRPAGWLFRAAALLWRRERQPGCAPAGATAVLALAGALQKGRGKGSGGQGGHAGSLSAAQPRPQPAGRPSGSRAQWLAPSALQARSALAPTGPAGIAAPRPALRISDPAEQPNPPCRGRRGRVCSRPRSSTACRPLSWRLHGGRRAVGQQLVGWPGIQSEHASWMRSN